MVDGHDGVDAGPEKSELRRKVEQTLGTQGNEPAGRALLLLLEAFEASESERKRWGSEVHQRTLGRMRVGGTPHEGSRPDIVPEAG